MGRGAARETVEGRRGPEAPTVSPDDPEPGSVHAETAGFENGPCPPRGSNGGRARRGRTGAPGPVRCRWGWWSSPMGVDRPEGIRDSKLLTEERREELFPKITAWCTGWSVGHADPVECDRLGMTAALRLAARRALDGLAPAPQIVAMDGSFDYVSDPPTAADRPGRRRPRCRRFGPWSRGTSPACPSPPPPSWPRSPGTG